VLFAWPVLGKEARKVRGIQLDDGGRAGVLEMAPDAILREASLEQGDGLIEHAGITRVEEESQALSPRQLGDVAVAQVQSE
jgi:hypothetical protein